jgi:hypothetical protein
LICTDGFAAYPKSILRAFREKVKNPYGIAHELGNEVNRAVEGINKEGRNVFP